MGIFLVKFTERLVQSLNFTPYFCTMTAIEIKQKENKAEIFIEGEKMASLNPQEIWELSTELRDFAIANASGFSAGAYSDIRVHGRCFKVLPLRHPRFWEMVDAGDWEPETYAVFNRFLNAQTIFLDIGAWIGSTALYGAQLAAETHAFEPDPVSFSELESNYKANSSADWFPKLKIHQKAISTQSGKVSLGSKNAGGDSMSSVLFQDENQAWQVDSIDLPSLVKNDKLNNKPIFIKMDIEGGEYELVPALKSFFETHQTSVFIALHPEFLLEAIQKGKGGIWNGFKVRYQFYKKHKKLLEALPFSHFEHVNGRPFHKQKYLLKALLLRNFPHTLVAYNG